METLTKLLLTPGTFLKAVYEEIARKFDIYMVKALSFGTLQCQDPYSITVILWEGFTTQASAASSQFDKPALLCFESLFKGKACRDPGSWKPFQESIYKGSFKGYRV